MKFVIPMMFEGPNDKSGPPFNSFPELEALNPDFWQFELEAAKSYVPNDIKTGLPIEFDLDGFVKRAFSEATNYMFYLGSESIPPCQGKIFV